MARQRVVFSGIGDMSLMVRRDGEQLAPAARRLR